MEKDLDITKYKNLNNALNTMNDFYNKGQKNGKIFDEINLTQEQINKLKIKDHVLQYIKDKDNKEEEKTISININYKNNGFVNINNTTAVKNEGFTFDLFNGLNMDFNMNNNNNNNNNNKVNEENENGDEMGGYTGFQLMDDDDNKDKNNNNKNDDEEIQKKINELNEKIQNAVNVSNFFLINIFLFIER